MDECCMKCYGACAAPGFRRDDRRLGESLVSDVTFADLMAQRRLGETIRDVERRLLVLGAGGASSTAPRDQDLRAT